MLLVALASEFPEDQIDVVCTEASVPFKEPPPSNIHVHVLDARLPHEAQRLLFETFQVARLARRLRADVIWSLNVGPYIRTGIPQVLSLHNAFQVYPWRECAKYHPGSAPVLAGLRAFFRRSLRCSDAAIVQTPLMREYLGRISGAPERVKAIPKSVEELSERGQAGVPAALMSGSRDSSFKYLYVATIGPHKNHRVVIEATRMLVQRNVNVQLVLTLTTSEAESIAGDIARELIARGSLLCVGWVTKAQLRAMYDFCDGCVMPSLLESLSSCHLEAMAWSKPQIVSDCAFAHDTCGDAASFVPDAAPAWAGEMERVALNPAIGADLIERGHRRIAQFPSTWGHAARQVREFLASTVQQAARSNIARGRAIGE
jgi:glycosyltransferase involved in cell wall biosynthesis